MAFDTQTKKEFLNQIDLFVLDMDGTFYQGADGALLTGIQTIEGNLHYFNVEGALLTQGSVTWEGVTYWVTDGIAVPRA